MYQITRHCQQVYNELDRNISYNSQEQLLSGTRPIRSSFFGGKRQVIKVCANSVYFIHQLRYLLTSLVGFIHLKLEN